MHHRIAGVLVLICIALGGWSCASESKKGYDEVLMPLQTGSVLHRRVEVRSTEEKTSKPKTKKKPAAPKPEEEPSATPAPEEESTPPPDRFR